MKAAVAKSAHSDFLSLYASSAASSRPYLRLVFGGSPENHPEVYQAHSPITFVGRCRTPTLLVYGSDDSVFPSQGTEFYNALKEHGVDTELITYPGEGHGLSSYQDRLDFQRRLANWFDKYLK